MKKPIRFQEVSPEVMQRVASRMLDVMPPSMGYFAYTGEMYRKICGMSAEESVIDATLAQARARSNVERAGMRAGVADYVSNLRA